MPPITPQMLRDYLTDSLPDADLARIEKQLREDPALRAALQKLKESEDQGDHSVGAIWRRERVSCPKRDQIASFLQKALDPDEHDFIQFHLTVIGCPFCQANHDDLVGIQAQKGKKKK
jgi:hypothetical protein